MHPRFSRDVLKLDLIQEADKIANKMREVLRTDLRRRGFVVAMSGGIDSSVCAALAVKAVGPNKVFGLLMPEQDSSSQSLDFAKLLVDHLGINHTIENIGPTLEAIGCYRWRDEAIKATVPHYGKNWKNKIVISGGLEGKFNHFNLVVQGPDGEITEKRLALKEYLQIVAATNFKQRIRKTLEYFHADRLNYAVVGTPNRLEYDQGFFVKNGDGSADIKPIAHLYKTQVYDMAKNLGLPDAICNSTPTTDTYSMPQGQDEFYFALPYMEMDLALWAKNHEIATDEVAEVLGISQQQAEWIYKDIDAKRRATTYLASSAVLVDPVPEISLLSSH